MKKRYILGLLSTGLLLGACSADEAQDNIDLADGIQVVATTTHITDLVEIIGGEHVDVEGLMGPGVDPHEYQADTSDIEALNGAEVVAYNGLHLEAMMEDPLENIEESGTPSIKVEDAVDEEQIILTEQNEPDPHVWFDIEIWADTADHFAQSLGEIDTENAEYYQNNADAFKEELKSLKDYGEKRVQEIPEEQRVLVTAHDAFSYFGEEFDFEVLGIQGINTQTEAGTQDISNLADTIADKEIDAVFVESSVSSRNIEALIQAVESRGHNIELGGELYSDALGTDEEGAGTYIDMYQSNIDTIVDALN